MTVRGFKGFDKDLKCQGHQFIVGQSYTYDGPIMLCRSGWHFCEAPLDVFWYYPPADSRYAEVDADGVSEQKDSDSKRVAKTITIGAEIGLSDIIAAGVKFILKNVDFTNATESATGDRSAATNTGDRSAATNTGEQSAATNTGEQSAATNTGYRSAATNTGEQSAATNTGEQSAATNTGEQSAAVNTGYRSAAVNTGYRSAAVNTGDQSAATNTGEQSAAMSTGYRSAAINMGDEGCAVSLGIEGKAKGSVGCWLTLAEWFQTGGTWHRIDVQTRRIDGKTIKPDTFYRLKGGQFVEAEALAVRSP